MTRSQTLMIVIIALVTFGAAYSLFSNSSNDSFKVSDYRVMVKGDMKRLTFYDQPKPLPDHIIQIADGSPVKLSSLKGKVLFINLWASWCAPCKVEMHDVAKLQKTLGGDTFEVVAINQDIGGLKRADRTLKEWKVDGLNLYADKNMTTASKMAQGKLPTSYLVDKNGMMVAEYVGPLDWASEDAIALIRAMTE